MRDNPEHCDASPAATPPGYLVDQRAILARLRRIEGQVRGIHAMVEQERYCIDVLQQVSAVTRALQGVALSLLDDHLAHCVVHAVEVGGEEKDRKLREASAAIARLVRSS
jgi:DNA-binding FrmR family transcriptional regulator